MKKISFEIPDIYIIDKVEDVVQDNINNFDKKLNLDEKGDKKRK